MCPHRRHIERPSVTVVAGVDNIGPANHGVKPTPKVGVVVPLHNILARVRQAPAAEQETTSPVVQIVLVVALKGVGNKRRASLDRKSTRLNSSHLGISYAVFCLTKKK